MEFQILGSVRAVHDGAALALGGPRHRRLLAVLLLHAGQPVPIGRLAEALWGDEPPRRAAEMVHVRVSELRAALRPARGGERHAGLIAGEGGERHAGLIAGEGGYRLAVAEGELDSREFTRLAAAGSRALAAREFATASELLADALSRWRGPALGEFADEPFARVEAARLEALRAQATEDRFEAELAAGRHGAVVAGLLTAVAEHPLRERFRAQLMLALYRSGRQGDALAQFAEARATLADQLGVDPGPDLAALHEEILRHDPKLAPHPAASKAGGRPVAAEALTSFVGRERDLAETRARLRAGRLVTLTGPGGAGKTRLALEVAADFPGDTWLVELAALPAAGLVAPAVSAALRGREPRDTAGLLLLDNCEHVLDEVAALAEQLLRARPGLRILATSRERLGIVAERLWPVGGLGTPAAGEVTAAGAGRSDAVRLLVDRAAAVQPGFALTDATAPALAQICRRLDGLPLAIELAAAAVPALGAERIAARLDDRFALLSRGSRTAEPRHRTLRAVVDWSYDLLDDPARRLFDRLGVFAGGFTLEAAEAVCADAGDPPVAASLAGLVDKSLVTRDGERYRLLETLRAYAIEHGAVTPGLRDRHAEQTLGMVASARRALRGSRQPAWLRRLEREHGNIRAALDWSIARGDAATAVRLAGSLYPLWDRHGHYREGREWLTRALAIEPGVPPLVRARALDSLAGLAVIQGDLDAGAAAAEESAALSRQAGDPAGVARALTTSGLAAFYAGDNGRAVAVLEESVRQARAAGDRGLAGFALMYLGATALARDAYAEAVSRCEEAEPDLRAAGDPEGLAWIRIVRCGAAVRTGEGPAAVESLAEAIGGFETLDHRWGLSICLQLAAEIEAARGETGRTAWLVSASETLRHDVDAADMPFLRAWRAALIASCRGDPGFATEWAAGAAAPIGDAVDRAKETGKESRRGAA
ncbi:AfsR/SARP family transcriptional regulator [Paractinoplanes globisporus]|uniref:BTAD domain-containing putative transcriptional regulator n=1 Tax=Paractinoplanes globisporus TaxID=113565 RepID=A0ABW6WTQ1_9ACTN|nr:BTAD domain-containing putative transcriptional regulator [Actinoplanes globisporus]